jgi:hypothetical protein
MRINRIGFHHRFVGGIIQVAVSGSVGEPDIPYLSAWHDLNTRLTCKSRALPANCSEKAQFFWIR